MAGRYICPVCDRRLKTKHFCTYCKSFVKEPVFYTGPVANEHYDSSGRQSCMADQHYGLGHVHGPGDRQKEYGHHRAGTGAGQSASGRQNTYAGGNRPAQRPVRSGQSAGYGAGSVRGQAAGSRNYGTRPNSAQSARPGQNSGRPQQEGANPRVKKFLVVFWVFIIMIVLGQVMFSYVGNELLGLSGGAFYFIPFAFVAQLVGMVFQFGFVGLIIWAIVRSVRRK